MLSDRLLLILAAVGHVPIALSYGIAPSAILPGLIGVPVESAAQSQVFRAVMGLYLAMAAFWLAGALGSGLRRVALWSLFVFMAGLAAGRIVSLILDGWPGGVLFLYLGLEIAFGLLAAQASRRSS